MAHYHHQCFVIADGGRARFVTPSADNALHTLEALESTDLHKRAHDLGADRPGRSFESGSPTRHAYSPRHDPHDLAKDKFARLVGEKITAESAQGLFDELILVAPSHVLAELRETLDPPTLAKLTGVLAKDLTKTADHELWPHLKTWVRPVERR